MNEETMTTTPKPPVLVLGWIPRIVLTVARSLHRHGIPVDVATCVRSVPMRSSAIRHSFHLPYPNDDPLAFLAELRTVLQPGSHELLIPCDDLAIAAIMEHYSDISGLVRIACPPPEIMRQVLRKECAIQVAGDCGLRVPRTVKISNTAEFPDLARNIPFPWILKPSEKEKRFEEFTSCRLNALDEIAEKYPRPQVFDPPMLVQEFCEGVGVGVECVLHQGECHAIFQHRRLKELPYSGGVAVTAVAENPDPLLVEQSLSLLRRLNWDGVAMVEFRVNPATGEAVFMEVNGRYWGSISLPVSSGLDFPVYHWQLLHGEKPSVPRIKFEGQRWRWTVGYLSRLYRLVIAGRNSGPARQELRVTLRQLPADFGPSVKDALFSLSDPLPSLLEFLRLITFYTGHTWNALLRRLPVLANQESAHKTTGL